MARWGGGQTHVVHLARVLGIALLLSLVYLLGATAAPTAAIVPLTISGRVVDAAGMGIPNVNVSAYQGGAGTTCCAWVTAVNSDASGNYVLSIAPGTYRVQFYPASDSTFVSRWWSAAGTARLFDAATDIQLGANDVLPDTTLETGFLLGGTVNGTSGPLGGVNVSAYAAGTCCSWVASGVTSAAGTYSIRVPAGTYRVQFYPPQTTSYIASWWDGGAGARTFERGVDVAVSADVAGKNATLVLGRRLSGTVTDGVNPIVGANASAFVGGAAATCCTWVIGAQTDAAGAYSLIVPDGTYRLSFTGPTGSSYVSKWWDSASGAARFENATDIVLSADRAGTNATLPPGRRISGRVTSDGVNAIGGAGVSAYLGGPSATCCTWVAGTSADADGNYSFVVPDGVYRFRYNGPAGSTYVSSWWDGGAGAGRFQLATDVSVGANAIMNTTLAAGVRVTGRVTASDGTTGIGRVGVSANLGGTSGCCTWIGGASTDDQGNYTLVVPAGTYRFYYSPPADLAYIGQWWNGANGAAHFDSASDVTLATAVSGQNLRLASGVRVSGRVTSDGTAGISGAGVSAYLGGPSAVCCTWAAGTSTASDGSYTLVVPAGTYRLYVGPPRGAGYMGQWWNGGSGASRFDLASDLDVSTDSTGRNATLGSGVAITGTVTSSGTAGIAQVGVSAYLGGPGSACCTWVSGTGTANDGSYTLVVPAGATYRVQFSAPRGSAFLGKWWDGAAGAGRFDQAADIAVAGSPLSGMNVSLATGRRISGRVTSDGTTGIAGVGVSAFTGGSGATCCTWISGTGTDGLGNYSLTVPDGTYRLQFYPSRGSPYLSRWWTNAGGATSFNSAADIPVASDVAGKDTQLSAGLRISGRITSGGAGLASVSVSAYVGGSSASCCTWVSGTGTDALGNYTLVVPPGGTYRLQVWPQRGSSYLGQWWTASGGAARFDLADDMSVTADLTGRDLALLSGVRISGRVTSNGVAGISSVGVQAYVGGAGATCCVWINGTGTDIDGSYSLTVPAGASYRLRILAPSGSSYLGQWWTAGGGALTFGAADDVAVASADVTGRNATLAAGVLISGTVRNTSAAALQGVWVNAMICSGMSCSGVAGASTDAAGAYRVAVPANATYQVSFNAPYGSPYVGQWYRNASGLSTATGIVVTTTDVTGVDATLATGTVISGTLTNGTSAIANGRVNAYTCSSTGSCQWVAGSNTATNGTYQLIVPAGTYKIQFTPPNGTSYIGQWYANASGPTAATDVVVGTAPRTGIDAALATGHAIAGTVRSGAGSGIANANVSAQVCGSTGGCQWIAGTSSASDGTYRLVVPAGTYTVSFSAPYGSNYVGQWYSHAATPSAATPVPVGSSDVPGIDATLAAGTAITGTVSNAAGAGITNVNVSAFVGCDQNGNNCQWVAGTNTASGGTYRLIVPAGTYRIQFYPGQSSSFIAQWYSAAANPTTATAVTVGAADLPGINASLVSGFAITGTVTDSGAVGIANANVTAFACTSSGCQFIAGGRSAANGTYRLLVPAGTYQVRFSAPTGSNYIGQWYLNAASTSTATPVTASTADVPNINATLATGVAITGTVTDGTVGVVGTNVQAFTGCDSSGNNCQFVAGAATASDGTYRLVVPAGTYRIQFRAPQGSHFIDQWYSGAANQVTAAVVTAGTADVPNINATLASGFVISGTVRDASNVGIANVSVAILICNTTNGCQGSGTRTAADGTYRMVVAPSTYKVRFTNAATVQWWNNATSSTTATDVLVTNADVPGIGATFP